MSKHQELGHLAEIVMIKFEFHVYMGLTPGSWFNINMSFYRYGKFHCEYKTVLRSFYLRDGISCIGKMATLYWISPLELNIQMVKIVHLVNSLGHEHNVHYFLTNLSVAFYN